MEKIRGKRISDGLKKQQALEVSSSNESEKASEVDEESSDEDEQALGAKEPARDHGHREGVYHGREDHSHAGDRAV